MAVDVNYYQYLVELTLQEKDDREVLKAEKYLQKGLGSYPQSLDLHILATKFYRIKKYLICQKNDPGSNVSLTEDKVLAGQNDCQRQAVIHYKKSCKLFKADPSNQTDIDVMAEIAELHLLFELPDASDELYKQALSIREDHIPSIVGRGVISNVQENYKDSISLFKKALSLDADDLAIKSNLAEVYLRNGNYAEAEKGYKDIIALTANNQDALIGLGELYKTLGDQAKAKNNKVDMQDYYDLSKKWYSRSIQLQAPAGSRSRTPSKRLTANDLSSIYYSLGYMGCSLYEATATAIKPKREELQEARAHFQKIHIGTDNYLNGQSAIVKIDRALDQGSVFTTKAGGGWIIALAIVVFILTQIGYFFTGEKAQKSFYIPAQGLKELMAKAGADSLYPAVVSLTDSPYHSILEAEKSLHTLLGKKGSTNIPDISKIVLPAESEAPGFRAVGDATYITLTFGCLIFIVIGFFVGEISKLKLGNFELEKTVIDQVNTITPNLGISPSLSVMKS